MYSTTFEMFAQILTTSEEHLSEYIANGHRKYMIFKLLKIITCVEYDALFFAWKTDHKNAHYTRVYRIFENRHIFLN